MQSQQLNRKIAQLEQQLPQQRRQLGEQTRAVTKAVHNRLSSPAALALAACSGALFGWWLYGHDHNASEATSDNSTSSDTLINKGGNWLARYLWTGLMAYLVRKLV